MNVQVVVMGHPLDHIPKNRLVVGIPDFLHPEEVETFLVMPLRKRPTCSRLPQWRHNEQLENEFLAQAKAEDLTAGVFRYGLTRFWNPRTGATASILELVDLRELLDVTIPKALEAAAPDSSKHWMKPVLFAHVVQEASDRFAVERRSEVRAQRYGDDDVVEISAWLHPTTQLHRILVNIQTGELTEPSSFFRFLMNAKEGT